VKSDRRQTDEIVGGAPSRSVEEAKKLKAAIPYRFSGMADLIGIDLPRRAGFLSRRLRSGSVAPPVLLQFVVVMTSA